MKKKQNLLIVLICIFVLLLGTTLFVSFSNQTDVQEVIVKSMTPVYDETSGVIVDNKNVIFNDKNQVVKYNVVLENTQDYDVKISDIKLSTPTEEFLQYKVEGISTEDVLEGNSTKELVVSFETMRIDGWGRNFADELTANISFEKVVKEVVPPVEDDKEEDKQPEAPATNTEELISKAEKIEIIRVTKDTIEFKENNKLEKGDKLAVWIYSKPIFLGYFDVVEKDGIKQIVGLEEALKKTEIISGEHNVALVSEENETVGYINVYVNEDKEVLNAKPQDTTDKEETSKEEDKTTEEESKEETPKEEDKPTEEENTNKEETDNKDESSSVNKPSGSKPSTDNKDESVKEENKVENPYTSDKKLVGILGIATCVTGVAIIIVSKNKLTKYTVFILMLSPAFTITNAEEVIEVAIKNNVSFESQNVMSKAYKYTIYCATDEYDADGNCIGDNWNEQSAIYFWKYQTVIRNYYIQNEVSEIKEYEYKYDVSESQNGRVMAYLVETEDNSICINGDGNEEPCYNLYLQADGMIYPNEDASYYFADMYNLELIDNLLGLDTSSVTDMSYMFYQTPATKTNFVLDLSSFDTSNVRDMSHMFEYTGYSNPNFTLDVSSFNTRNVTDMSYMFSRTGFSDQNFTLDVSGFDTSSVTEMHYMFWNAGYNSSKFNTSITIKNPYASAKGIFQETAFKDGSQIVVNYTSETEELVDWMITQTGRVCSKYEEVYDEEWYEFVNKCVEYIYPNIVKGNLVVDVENLYVGREIRIGTEKFNIISSTDDTVTMLAQYNLSTDYRQSTTENKVTFSDGDGWEYTPGPKEIDIQTWTTNPKTYVNAYVEYLKEELGNDTVTGDLITLKDLEELGCTVPSDYALGSGGWNCHDSPYGWLVNDQYWWTCSAYSLYYTSVWFVWPDGRLENTDSKYSSRGIRPVITISKETLKGL